MRWKPCVRLPSVRDSVCAAAAAAAVAAAATTAIDFWTERERERETPGDAQQTAALGADGVDHG